MKNTFKFALTIGCFALAAFLYLKDSEAAHTFVVCRIAEATEASGATSKDTAAKRCVELAERLNALAPITNAKSLFFTTGAEATEAATESADDAAGAEAHDEAVAAESGEETAEVADAEAADSK